MLSGFKFQPRMFLAICLPRAFHQDAVVLTPEREKEDSRGADGLPGCACVCGDGMLGHQEAPGLPQEEWALGLSSAFNLPVHS